MTTTRIADVIVPEIFTQYVQNYTTERSEIIRSGAMAVSSDLSGLLAGGGLTFNHPFWFDLKNDAENISTDDPDQKSVPFKTGAGSEVQVRMNRNNSWSTMDLTAALAGDDPMMSIVSRVGDYWVRRLQAAFIAAQTGVYAMDAAAPVNGSTHVQNDMTFNASGAAFQDGVTNFNAENFMDALQTMGDNQSTLSLVTMHSVVFTRAKKNNLIDYVSDSVNGNAVSIPTFLGKRVVVDDGMPNTAGVFETWLYGAGAWQMGQASPAVPTEVNRIAEAGNGSGQDILHNRVQWCLHPVGHAYAGTPPNGGPSNAATANNLAAATSWVRRFPERKQIRMARLLTREYGA